LISNGTQGLEPMKSGLFSLPAGSLLRLAVPVAAAFLLAACATPPPRTVVVPSPPPQRIFVYPASGQSAQQTDRDRYECHVWAVQQTGVDPSRADANAYERVVVQPATPPGAGAMAGMIGGAIIGSIIGGPYNSGAGAVIGGATGAIVGSAADANAQAQAHQTQQQFNQSSAAARARADSYRRAIGACLQGRGYTVT
jgi:uncharacterized protein YcfJ